MQMVDVLPLEKMFWLLAAAADKTKLGQKGNWSRLWMDVEQQVYSELRMALIMDSRTECFQGVILSGVYFRIQFFSLNRSQKRLI